MAAIRLLALLALVGAFSAMAPSDTWRDIDIGQSSYAGSGHGMDPAVIASSEFTGLWNASFDPMEKFYARPLIYTPKSTGRQVVFLASTGNWIRTLDARTGEVIKQRQVRTPYPMATQYCSAQSETLGIMGTPTIDPDTGIAYFWSKSYIEQLRTPEQIGMQNGVYYFYAVDVATLEDVEGYPLLVDAVPAQNDARKYFLGTFILQRPSLLQLGDVVYAGFGGLCDQFNYTGTILGVNIKTKKLVTNFVTQAGPTSDFTLDWTAWHGGGGGGIWQAGMGLASDGEDMFFVTDNGGDSTRDGAPPTSSVEGLLLSETVNRVSVKADELEVKDFFKPFDYQNDEGMDLGSGGIALLNTTTFTGTNAQRIAVVGGKNGKVYILDVDKLGGYRMGAGETDAVLQTIDVESSVYGGTASNPLDGGYLYVAPMDRPLLAFRLERDPATGAVSFLLAGMSEERMFGTPGVGTPVVTSFGDKDGSSVVWVTDPAAGLRAWHAVPQNGTLKSIALPEMPGNMKYSRPVFGDGVVYVTGGTGSVYAFGKKE